jgi:uncharacterized membrane protein YobD (UPF0266 family)
MARQTYIRLWLQIKLQSQMNLSEGGILINQNDQMNLQLSIQLTASTLMKDKWRSRTASQF